ncbi:hypothetical protein QR680_002385 [Steinernema hermaphroditum]|uniref:UDP-glucuronosyltransferase n=1 Tax=Steinernema hermaphroditum TaxID=289476 RepID=A0AA39LHM1_9BILA|nr:hypothetical protein QR680_002385 [Steinernema hermaphroditum]
MHIRSILCVLATAFLLSTVSGYKILVYSQKNGRSQVIFMGRLADILVEAGHDVTVLLVEQNPDVTVNGTEKAKVITVPADERVAAHFQNDRYIAETWTMSATNPFSQRQLILDYAQTIIDQCSFTAKQTEVFEKLKETKFDLLLHELFDFCQLGIMQMLGIEKHVAMQSTVLFEAVAEAIGVPYTPSITPSVCGTSGNNMSIVDKITNLIHVSISKEFISTIQLGEEEIFERKMRDKLVPFQDKISTASFIITNSDPFLDFPHSTNSRMVELGGIAVRKPQELDQDWKRVLEKRNTAVLISFGSIAKSYTMPDGVKESFVEMFKQFPDFTFIWKYEKEDTRFLNGIKNVHISPWVPQNDVLNHPNLKLFISHGGMNSMLETAHRGVPVVVVPLFADQMRNAQMMQRVGVGLNFNRFDLSDSAKLTGAVRKVLMERRYTNTAKHIASMIANRPTNLQESFVRHVEFAAKFGPVPSMVSTAPQTTFATYYLIDVAAVVLMAFLISLLILFCCIRQFLRCIFGNRKVKTKSKMV